MTIVVRAVVGGCQVAVHIWRLLPIPRRRNHLSQSSSSASASATKELPSLFFFFKQNLISSCHIWPNPIFLCFGESDIKGRLVNFCGWYILIPISPVLCPLPLSSPPRMAAACHRLRHRQWPSSALLNHTTHYTYFTLHYATSSSLYYTASSYWPLPALLNHTLLYPLLKIWAIAVKLLGLCHFVDAHRH